MDKTLLYYDGPLLLLRKTLGGQIFLVWASDAGDLDVDRWIYLPLSIDRLQSVLSGRMPSREAIQNPEDGYVLIIDVDENDEIISVVHTTPNEIPEKLLPLPRARLNISMPVEELGILEDALIVATRDKKQIVDIKLDSDNRDTKRVSVDIFGWFVSKYQKLADALGQANLGNPTSRGTVSLEVRRQTRLNIVAGCPGSFVARLESAESENLFGNSLLTESLTKFYQLLEAGDDPEKLSALLGELKTRVASCYHDWLGSVETSIPSIQINWAKPGSTAPQEIRLSRQQARNIRRQIEATTKILHSIIEIEAQIITGSSERQLAFEIRDVNTGDTIRCNLSQTVRSQTQGGFNVGQDIYKAALQEFVETDQATGDTRISYTLLSITPQHE